MLKKVYINNILQKEVARNTQNFDVLIPNDIEY